MLSVFFCDYKRSYPSAERTGFVPRRKPKGKRNLTLTARFAFVVNDNILPLPLSKFCCKNFCTIAALWRREQDLSRGASRRVSGATPLRSATLFHSPVLGAIAQTPPTEQQKRKGVLPFLILVRLMASLRLWRREQDLNLRRLLTSHAFQACALNRSTISPNSLSKQKGKGDFACQNSIPKFCK